MALPELTPQQRQAALDQAAAARTQRAEIKAKLKYSAQPLSEVLDLADTDDAIAKMRVAELLESLPGIGEVKARGIMAEFGISPTRRIRGLGRLQRMRLVERFG